MSYSFKLTFWHQRKNKIPDTLNEIMDYYRDEQNVSDFLKENLPHMPSNVYFANIDTEHDEKLIRYADEEWLYNILTFHFIYWPEHKLMAFVGDLPSNLLNRQKTVTIRFQNSTDRDYPLEPWTRVPALSRIARDITVMSKRMMMKSDEVYTRSGDILGYGMRSDVYDAVYRKLHLNDWLYSKKGPFLCLNVSPIDDFETRVNMWYILKALRKNGGDMDG